MKIFQPHNVYNENFIVFGHRGVPQICPENTLESFKKAIELEYDGVELDVMLTKDNVLIVHHDLEVQVNGTKKDIIDLQYQDIVAELPNKPPALEEILSSIGHQTKLNIEIKDQKKGHLQIVQKIINYLKQFNLIDNIVISSFNPQVIKDVQKTDDRFATAWIWGNKNFYFFNSWKVILNYFNPNAIHAKHTLITHNLVEKIQSKNIKILAHTVNEESILLDMISKKINGVFTDSPSILLAAKNQAP